MPIGSKPHHKYLTSDAVFTKFRIPTNTDQSRTAIEPAMFTKSKPFAAHWMYLWAGIFSIAWLLPKANTIWFDFQTEVWVSAASLLAAAALLWKHRGKPLPAPFIAAALAALSLIPITQWAFGLIALVGHAWLCSLYLFGFAMAIWFGFAWEKAWPGQCLDALFFAIGLAALVTVCLQVAQWRGFADESTWWVVSAAPTRPNGNFGQANLAATFLCWGLCGVAWFATRGRIRYWPAILVAAVLLFGIALSNSRTAFLGLLLSIAVLVWCRQQWAEKKIVLAIGSLAFYFLACLFFIQWINQSAFRNTVLNPSSLSARWEIWAIVLEAIKERPWLGYGWGQTYAAQLAVADRLPGFGQAFTSAHNLALDLVLWVGVPMGLLLLAGLGLWLYRSRPRHSASDALILWLFIMLFCNHAMLELPFQYAFLLLPLGWVVGALEARRGQSKLPFLQLPRAVPFVAVGFMALLLHTMESEYLIMDEAYGTRLLKILHIPGAAEIGQSPWVLTHIAGQVRLALSDGTQKGLHPAQLQEMEAVALFAPGASPMVTVAGTLAMNNQPERARWWLRRICKVTSEKACSKVQANWKAVGEKHPEIAAVAWPDNKDDTKPN